MDNSTFTEYQPYIFLLLGLIVLSLSLLVKAKKSELKQTGIPVDGIIFDGADSNKISSSIDSSNSINDKITVRFVTQNEEWITEAVNQEFQISYTGQYKNGETVKVYYDKNNPRNFYVDTKQSEFKGRLVGGLVGLGFILLGLFKLFVA